MQTLKCLLFCCRKVGKEVEATQTKSGTCALAAITDDDHPDLADGCLKCRYQFRRDGLTLIVIHRVLVLT